MARVTIEDCLDKISNRFTLVIVVAKRLRQLLKGDQPLVEVKNKFVVTALREVAAGRLSTNFTKEELVLKIEKALKRKPLALDQSENQDLNEEDSSN